MKALVYHGPEDLRFEEVSDIFPKDNEVKIKVRAIGICGSDVHGYAGLTGRRIAPMIMGHEFSGEVVEVGKDVKHLKIGDRVAPYPVEICGTCEFCRKGMEHICLNKKAYGVLDCNGAMADYICVPENIAFPLDDSVDYSTGAMIEPMSVALRGVDNAGDIEGKNVLIIGAGTIGLFALVLVKMRNPAKIFVSDLSSHRLSVAKQLGADVVIRSDKEDAAEAVRKGTNGLGADVSIECVGITPTTKQAVSALKLGGTSVWVGNSAKFIETNMQEIVTHELTVKGSFLYTLKQFKKVIDILGSGSVDISPIISKEINLEEGPDMFHTLYKNPGDLIKVVIRK